jgi:hypothetical protein
MAVGQYEGLLFVPLSVAATTTTVIAAVAKKSIVVIHCNFDPGAGTVLFQDTTPTDLTGTFPASRQQNMAGTRNEPLFSTANGKGLQVVSGAGGSCQGAITYFLSDAE